MPTIAKILFAVLFLSSCSQGFTTFPVDSEGQSQEGYKVVRLSVENAGSFNPPNPGFSVSALPVGTATEYKIGAGDGLNVVVFDHPELGFGPTQAGTSVSSGFFVQTDGSFNFPLLGRVVASGKTVTEVREELARRLSEFIPSPQVEVRVVDFGSQRVIIAGEVKNPIDEPITNTPVTLVTAINSAGGLTDMADSRAITVRRAGRSYRVDLDGYLSGGIDQNNPILRGGDVVSVPKRRSVEAYLLGQTETKAAIDLSQEEISLTQAITRLGGIDELRADARGIFVFREVGSEMIVFQLETSTPEGLFIGTKFLLAANDVVYVVRSPLARWNDTISSLLPSVNATRAAQVVATNG